MATAKRPTRKPAESAKDKREDKKAGIKATSARDKRDDKRGK